MPEIVKTTEDVMIAGKHFDKNTVVECDDADAGILISIGRAVKATPEDIREYLGKAKKNTVAKQAPREIVEADAEAPETAAEQPAEKPGKKK